MRAKTYRWAIAPGQPLLTAPLAAELQRPQLLIQCLLNRGLSTPEAMASYLEPRLRQLKDPFLLPNMEAAVKRLLQARNRQERVVIFGDYDVDGVTSTALLEEVLTALGWMVAHYLPHRLEEGYGLSRDGVENCLRKFPCTLLLAVDCGSTAVESIAWLGEQGVDVLVLDHHQVSTPHPAAVALVNPQIDPSSENSSCELCSVGLAFKLAHALVKRGRELQWPEALAFDLRPLLDLVALGTIADLVPLKAENRILVTAGLERLRTTTRPGLQALKSVAQISNAVGVFEVGFQLAPRLNAAGRLETASQALDLLLARDGTTALAMARSLDARNRERQEIERHIAQQAIGAIAARFQPASDYVLVEAQLLWHIGVVGIVASRVLREFHRPTLIIGGESGEWRGSGRSIEGFDLASALRQCDDLLIRHGGHAMAAGLSIDPAHIDALRQRLNDLARRTLTAEQLQPCLRLDAVTDPDHLTLDLIEALGALDPVGMGNPPVQLAVCNVSQRRPAQRLGREGQHLKLWIGAGQGSVEVVWWNADRAQPPEGPFDLACAPQINTYQGRRSIQLKLLDWRPTKGG